jgi:hypothetical protein
MSASSGLDLDAELLPDGRQASNQRRRPISQQRLHGRRQTDRALDPGSAQHVERFDA